MCDFERRAKAEPKTAGELAQAIGPQREDLETSALLVQQVLDHFARSRLAVMVAGRYSLIHDYWVALIYDATIHDRGHFQRAVTWSSDFFQFLPISLSRDFDNAPLDRDLQPEGGPVEEDGHE